MGARRPGPRFGELPEDRPLTYAALHVRSAPHSFAGGAGYTASKAAVIAFARAVAEEGRPDGVRCNAILPTMIDAPANRAAMPEDEWHKLVPPERIASVVTFLCSDASKAINGAQIAV